MTVPKPKLRWFQYRWRMLLVVVTLCTMPCSWLGVKIRQAKREHEVAVAIEKMRGFVGWSKPSGPVWLRGMLEVDLFSSVDRVLLGDTQLTDADFKNLNLKALNQLQMLDISSTKITDAGLENLNGLQQLHELWLDDNNVTDAALEHLKALKKLEFLYVSQTKITDAGVEKLRQALPNCQISH